MCKLPWTISAILLLILVIVAYKFIVVGEVTEASDGRQAIVLQSDERDFVLAEMRLFLSSVQAINQAIAEGNPQQVASAARMVGMAVQQTVPPALITKLPLAFKQQGFDTHQKFDLLAMDAEQIGDGMHSLQQLAELMQNCVACHAAYRIDPAQQK
ncbi:MAG: hypothetical protein EP315_03520 [Gammaproteobacteria bacterium]|nr:MAG: hypothetical protein EP315_03520 [Gammaproteobacteria bacterium]